MCFNGWSGMALRSMRRAKAQGAVTVLCTGSAHIAYQKKLLQAEYAKFGLKRMITHPRIVEKGVQEYVEADHIIVPSTFVRRTLLAEGIEAEKISVVPHPLTRQFLTSSRPDSVFRIVAVGRLEFRKGIQYLMEAVSHLRLPNSELLLIGRAQGDFGPLLEKYAGHYRLAGRVSDDKLGEIFSQASVCVVPSVEDGWGHVTWRRCRAAACHRLGQRRQRRCCARRGDRLCGTRLRCASHRGEAGASCISTANYEMRWGGSRNCPYNRVLRKLTGGRLRMCLNRCYSARLDNERTICHMPTPNYVLSYFQTDLSFFECVKPGLG